MVQSLIDNCTCNKVIAAVSCCPDMASSAGEGLGSGTTGKMGRWVVVAWVHGGGGDDVGGGFMAVE